MSYVYLILDEKSVAVKIGKSNCVEERLSSLQTGNPNELKIIWCSEYVSEQHSFMLEKEYHEKFKDLRISGEWFRYDEKIFNEFISEQTNFKLKQKRAPLTIHTLFGEEEVVSINSHPRCHFYPNHPAQLKVRYEDFDTLKIPYRTMAYPTYGQQMLLPFSKETDRVFISYKKHNENLELKRFEKLNIKSKLNTLWD